MWQTFDMESQEEFWPKCCHNFCVNSTVKFLSLILLEIVAELLVETLHNFRQKFAFKYLTLNFQMSTPVVQTQIVLKVISTLE